MAQQRILVTGAAGNLGQDLLARLSLFQYFDPVGTTSEQLNLTWEKQRIIDVLDLLQPDVIINTAAFTGVDAAESDVDTAMEVNQEGPAALAEWTKQKERYLVHISTDYVFDGGKGSAYNSDDPTNPINRYGASKLAGEVAVQSMAPERSAIVRTSWLYGPGAKNFVPFVIQSAQHQTPIRVAMDQWGTPTWTGNLCKMLLEVLEQRPTGILHGCCKGVVTRYEQAEYICASLGLSANFMTPVSTESFHFPARRPVNTAMNTSFTCALDWQEATQRFLLTQGLLKHHV